MNGVSGNYDAEIDLVLAYHKGDVRASIEALLKDRDFLAREIELSRLALTTASVAVLSRGPRDENVPSCSSRRVRTEMRST